MFEIKPKLLQIQSSSQFFDNFSDMLHMLLLQTLIFAPNIDTNVSIFLRFCSLFYDNIYEISNLNNNSAFNYTIQLKDAWERHHVFNGEYLQKRTLQTHHYYKVILDAIKWCDQFCHIKQTGNKQNYKAKIIENSLETAVILNLKD